MKIIDIRNTQSHGLIADVYLTKWSILPTSIPVDKCDPYALMEFAASDPEHDAIHDPRTPEEKAWDTLTLEWEETYQSLL